MKWTDAVEKMAGRPVLNFEYENPSEELCRAIWAVLSVQKSKDRMKVLAAVLHDVFWFGKEN